jgi:hypothetical protein
MMSSTVWTCLVLLFATPHSVSGTAWYRCITRPVAMPDKWSTMLLPGYSHTVLPHHAVSPELLNHSAL